MVGPKPKPVRPLTASKNGFEKPTDTKKVKKTKGKTPRGSSVGKKMEKKFMEMEGDFKTSSKSEIKNSGKTVYLEPDKIEEAVKAFLKLLKVNSAEKKDLFGSEGQKVTLQVAGVKIPREREQQVIKLRLPHCPLPPTMDVCLFVKDLEKGIKVDHEDTVRHFTDLLAEKGVKGVTQVISLRELKVEYKQFEAKLQLCNKFDLFLADDRIIRLLPQFLGKSFYKRKKIPLQINLKSKDLQAEFSRCLTTTQLPMKHSGACSAVTVGNTEQEESQLVENTRAVVDGLVTKYPGAWQNIRSLNLNSGSVSLPLYVSLRSTSEVGLVSGNKRAFRAPVTGDLSTVVGGEVVVSPYGSVRVKRKADPNWTEEDETLQKITDDSKPDKEEDEDTQESGEKKETPAKKKKKQPEKAEKNSKKSAEDDSEDDMEDQELEYMKKVAEEEEEMERKLESDDQKLNKELQANQEEDADENEEDVDDDAEADNLISDEDDSEEDEDDIMMRKSLKELQEEIEEDPPAPKKKSKKAEKVQAKKKSKKEKMSSTPTKPVKSKEKKQQKFVESKKKGKAKAKK